MLAPDPFESRYEAHHARVMRAEEDLWLRLVKHGRCTAIVRLLSDNSDIIMAHASWEGYNEMLRIYKFYEVNLPGVASTVVSFSSYPGMLSSTDDWYITSAGLGVMETTTEIVDKSLLQKIQPGKTKTMKFVFVFK
jgi:hypothetical protein